MALTQHLGYGRYHLADFLPGEMLARANGSLALVCDPQPHPQKADRIQVWVDHGTSNARREFLHQSALAYAITEEQAWRIERRKKEVSEVSSPDDS